VGSLASAPRPAPSALGIAVQPLTPALATALSVHRGVVVSEVDPAGSAAGILEPADVITTLEGRPTEEPDDLLIQLASRPSGGSVSVSIARKGAVRTVALPLAATRPEGAEGGSVAFAREGGAGTHVVEGTEVAGTGLLPGDTVTHAGDIANPSPAQLRRMLAGVAPGGFAILTIRRDGRQRVLAVRTPDPDSAVRR
jgi:S1-C subfamily serine protease